MLHILSCGDLFSSYKFGLQNGDTRFLAMPPSDDASEDSNKRSKISYSMDFLLSFAKTESTELPKDDHLSISLEFEEGLLSPPFHDSDSGLDTNVTQLIPLKVTDEINDSSQKINISHRPPHHKEPYESSGFPNSTSLQKEEKRWKHVSHEDKSYVDKAPLSWYDARHVNKDKDCDKSSESFLWSISSGDFINLPSSSEATEQMDTLHKLCLIQETVERNALQLTMVPRIAKSYSNENQSLEDDFINNPVNLSNKYVSRDYHHNFSFLEEGFHLKEAEACLNLNVGHADRFPCVMEFHGKSISPILKLFEFGKTAKCKVLEDMVSPRLEDNKPFLSTVNKSAMVHCECNLFLDSVDQAISLSMKKNSSICGCQIQQDLDLNSFSKLEEKSTCSSDICLPDEDSLFIFDEPFLKPDEQNWDAVDEFVSSPEKNPIKDGTHAPSSPGDMIVRLVEAVLDDESSPASYLVDPEMKSLDSPYPSTLGGVNLSTHQMGSQTLYQT